jgi:N-acetylmuramoyl-L-alanine amidase
MNIIYKIKKTLLFSIGFFSVLTYSQSGTKFKVTLDAGHGGKDFGANYHGHVEKNITLAIVLKLGKILEKQPNVEVNYTRKTDVLIDLVERGYIANRVKANIFVSLHCNANKNFAASGTQTFVMGLKKNTLSLDVSRRENEVITLEKDYKTKYNGFDPNSPESYIGQTLMQEEFLANSISLASKIQEGFVTDLDKKNRGVAQDVFMVLHRATMPRVLIEMGFISNIDEGEDLDSEDGQENIARSIANAIMSYKKEYFDGEDFVYQTPKKITPKIEVPKVEAPKVDTPKIETPKIETPKTEAPKPVRDSPKTIIIPIDNDVKVETTIGTIYKIQLSASSKKMDLVPSNFKGLKNISMVSENKLYKYMYGNTADEQEIKKQLQEAKAKGYSSAFIVTYKDGKKI